MINIQEFIEKAKEIGANVDEFHVKQFEKYKGLLLSWNEKINLTAITEESEIINKHFIDSLTCAKYINSGDSVIDVGTGAGFPGIPLKIILTDIKLTLLDSLNKRIIYLEDVIENLQIRDVEAVHGRAEEFGVNKKYREKYDIAIARAVANMNTLTEYCLPFVKVGGKFICMKGSEYVDELDVAKEHIKELGGKITDVENIILPGTDISHTIIVIKKEKETPTRFPRRIIK